MGTKSRLPTFDNNFLNRLCRQIEKRTKALKHHGSLRWETTQPDEFEWVTISFDALCGPWITFQFVEDNRVSIFLQSKGRKDRGKILLALEDIKVVDSAKLIVEAIEETIRRSTELLQNNEVELKEKITKSWENLRIQIHAD